MKRSPPFSRETVLTKRLIEAITDQNKTEVDRCIASGVNVNAEDRFGRSPLSVAIATDVVWFVSRVLKAGADPNSRDRIGTSPLSGAVRSGRQPKILRALLRAGAGARAFRRKFVGPLLEACLQGQVENAKLLLDAGADISATDKFDVTTLMLAVSARSLPLVQFLISRGANIEGCDAQGQTALFCAAISRPMFFETETHKSGITLRTVEARVGFDDPVMESIIKLLLERGADLNRRNGIGRTPLTYVVSPSIANLMISAGAKLDIRDKRGHDVRYWLRKNRIEFTGRSGSKTSNAAKFALKARSVGQSRRGRARVFC